MGWTFVDATNANDSALSATLDASAALNVQAGDLLVVYLKHEGAALSAADLTFQKDSGSPANTFTFDSGEYHTHSNNDLHACMGYKIAASADATALFRMTLSGSRNFKRFVLAQFRPDSGETVTKDGSNRATGTSASPASGNISTTGTDEVVIGGVSTYSTPSMNTEQINGSAATEPAASPSSGAAPAFLFYQIQTATFSNGQATGNLNIGADSWTCGVMAFKSESGGGPTVTWVGYIG